MPIDTALAWLLIGRLGNINTKVGRLVLRVALGGALLATLSYTVLMAWMSDVANSTALRGHWGLVVAVAFSPDGRWLAAQGCDERDSNGYCIVGTARLWDVANPTAEPVLLIGDGIITAVAFSPDGRWLATGGWPARLWNPWLRAPSSAWMASLAAFALATGIGFVVAFSGPVRSLFGTLLGAISSVVIVGAAVGFAWALSLRVSVNALESFSIIGFVALVLALVARRVSRSLETGRPSWLARGVFAATPLAYLYIAIIYPLLLGAPRWLVPR